MRGIVMSFQGTETKCQSPFWWRTQFLQMQFEGIYCIPYFQLDKLYAFNMVWLGRSDLPKGGDLKVQRIHFLQKLPKKSKFFQIVKILVTFS